VRAKAIPIAIALAKLIVGAGCLYWALSIVPPSTWGVAFGKPQWLAIMIAAWIFNQVVCSLRLRTLLGIFGYHLPAQTCLQITFATFFVSSVFPGVVVGDATKIALLRLAKREGGLAELTLVTLVDRALGLLSLWFVAFVLSFVVSLPDTVAAHSLVWFVRIGVAIPIAIGLLVFWLALSSTAEMSKRLSGRALVLATRARDILIVFSSGRSIRLMATAAVPLSILAVAGLVFAQAGVGAMVLSTLGEAPNFTLQAMLAPTSLIVAAMPISPSGIGVSQVTLVATYHVAALNTDGAVLLTTVVQISQLLVGATFGAFAFLTLRRARERTT
jgi:uncharacterized protein (TIRG00374 family)